MGIYIMCINDISFRKWLLYYKFHFKNLFFVFHESYFYFNKGDKNSLAMFSANETLGIKYMLPLDKQHSALPLSTAFLCLLQLGTRSFFLSNLFQLERRYKIKLSSTAGALYKKAFFEHTLPNTPKHTHTHTHTRSSF